MRNSAFDLLVNGITMDIEEMMYLYNTSRSLLNFISPSDVCFTGMGSENVATVLRQSGASVRLVVARPAKESSLPDSSQAVVLPTETLDDYLTTLVERLMQIRAAENHIEVCYKRS